MKTFHANIAVIGAGAAGMLAAWRSSQHTNGVILLEKNEKPGMKIRISGGGKCNVTHGGTISVMLKQFQKNEEHFLRYAFHEFTNADIAELLRRHGVETYERENGKVFPNSHNADDVVNVFLSLLHSSNVKIFPSTPVKNIIKTENGDFHLITQKEEFIAKKVILASGGSSYQKTGTTGDGFLWMKNFGHTITPIRPALAPIYFSPTPPAEWQGVPIRDCELKIMTENFCASAKRGDLLITHTGISGPAALEASKEAFLALEKGLPISAVVDFYPEHSNEELEKILLEKLQQQSAKQILSIIEQLIPVKLAENFLVQSGISPEVKAHQITKEARKRVLEKLKHWNIGTVSEILLDRGEVTAGGVDLKEISSTTMESKLISGLFACGEILDIAGPVGGYNLQAAFSTGYVAGENAGTSLKLQ
ncbi:MAG: aminoacetone oxidase family FAD-binding enzyme [Bacteroidetes bacterium]|nr:aminoacetone oxidase family FAD-binding enzyme [Bacteroidota bacterium]